MTPQRAVFDSVLIDGLGYSIKKIEISLAVQHTRAVCLGLHAARGDYGGCVSARVLGLARTLRVVAGWL